MPKLCAGAPGSPQNTWFHTPLVHEPISVFRVTYCCWEPFSTVPLSSESAMKPPLAQSGDPSQKSIRVVLPLMSTRRIGEACEAAHTSSPAKQPVRPATLIVRLETERQKLSVA